MTNVEVDYMTRSVSIVESIDTVELANRELGLLIGQSERVFIGVPTRTYAIGEIATSEGLMHLALKFDDHKYRVQSELADITIITQRAPELLPKFPKFIGQIAVEGNREASGILTEDASRGGIAIPRPVLTKESTLETFVEAFGSWSVFDLDSLEKHVAFDVDGEERLLDLYPRVLNAHFKLGNKDLYMEMLERAYDAEEEVTIRIPADSPLALSF